MFPMLYLKCIGSNTEINDVKESVNFFFLDMKKFLYFINGKNHGDRNSAYVVS